MAPSLKPVFTMRGYISRENTVDLKAIQGGSSRIIVPIISGFVEGEGIRAEVLPGGADWILANQSTGVAHIDVRTQARTADGHSLYVHYHGRLKLDEKANKVLGWKSDAKNTEYGDHYWFSAPIIETSDPKLKWVEDVMWIGQGHFVVDKSGSAVEYQIYQVEN